MICCSFMFRPGTYDDEFHRLDGEVDAFARSLPGFVSTQTWYSDDRSIVNAVYTFTDSESVKALAGFGPHRQAKAQAQRWYDSHHVVVSEITAVYGDPGWQA